MITTWKGKKKGKWSYRCMRIIVSWNKVMYENNSLILSTETVLVYTVLTLKA